MKHVMTSALMGAVVSASVFGAVAPLDPGAGVGLAGITHAQDPSLGGVVREDMVQAFEIHAVTGALLYTGALQSRVIERNDTGELDFAWRIRDVGTLPGEIASITVTGYTGWSVEVEYRTDSLGDVGPSSASRDLFGDAIEFGFNKPILGPGAESLFFFARTDAFAYGQTATATITLMTGESVVLSTFAPAAPAPGAAALLGLGGLVAMRRRR